MIKMITITKNSEDDFKTVIIVCYDKLHKKYRSLNYTEKTIASQVYDSPDDIVKSLQCLKETGRIKDYEIVKGGNEK